MDVRGKSSNGKRLIDANALLLKLKKSHDLFVDAWEGFSNLPEEDKVRVDEISNCIADVFNAPTIDAVEVAHGYWYEYYGIAICSHCQRMFDHDLKMLQVPSTWKMPNYCPNCGARMDLRTNDE